MCASDAFSQHGETMLRGHVKTNLPILFLVFALTGCFSSGEKVDITSFSPSEEQQELAGYYRDQAMMLKEKAAMIAESAVRYQRLFGPQSDWVSGAQQLSQYYAIAAQDLERRADEHDQAARTKRTQGK